LGLRPKPRQESQLPCTPFYINIYDFIFTPKGENKKYNGVQGTCPLPGSGGARGFDPVVEVQSRILAFQSSARSFYVLKLRL
jgi:hypothetical protein